MGLEKTKINDQGISVSYWHIDYVTVGHRQKRVTICLLGYIDKTKREHIEKEKSIVKQAYYTEAFARTKKPPNLEKLLVYG